MGWTSSQTRYSAKRWFCSMCNQRTPVELNPKWVAVGKPLKWKSDRVPWSWFSRCSYCQSKHWNRSSYECPRCGTPCEWPEPWQDEQGVVHTDGGTLLEMTKPQRNPRYSYEYGVDGYDWDERHQCRLCRHKWWHRNSSC